MCGVCEPNVNLGRSIASFPGSTSQLFSHCVDKRCEKSWEVEPGNEARRSTQSVKERVTLFSRFSYHYALLILDVYLKGTNFLVIEDTLNLVGLIFMI